MLPSPMKALGRKFKENSPDELHISVVTGRIKRMKHLLKNGVHIESVNARGQTPLYCASYGGDYEVASILLRLGANPNRRCGSNGASPVHAAAYRGSRKVLRLLVEHGGDLSLRDSLFSSPRDYATKQPADLRRQKILAYIELLQTMTLYRTPHASMAGGTSTLSCTTTPFGTLRSEGTLKHALQKQKSFFGSQISLNKKAPSTANIWASCVVGDNVLPPETIPTANVSKEVTLTENLRKNVSCHLLNELCVTTSLPLLTPSQLQRPSTPTTAYTCGGPTLFSSFTWLGTPVTVRRPTPHLTLKNKAQLEGVEGVSPDPNAVKSLLQELSLLRRLRHPGFLEVMAACHVTHPSPDHVTLVFQHVPHGSLYHHLHVQHHDLLVSSAVDMMVGLVEALLFMHAHGWLHCGLSSHAIHLVSLGCAKLGSFEHALESKAKGCGMRAEYLSLASWLRPWQAPETIMESMVSVRSEIYSLSVILWEIWSGMPPWSGVEETDVSKKIISGETLPALIESAPSLISYLTQYGLKWNDHERELDLQEVHTMLKSLRIQCRDEERVPAVTSWGPPSIPNTPVIGRSRQPEGSNETSPQCSESDLRLADARFLIKGGGCRLMDKTDHKPPHVHPLYAKPALKASSGDSGFSSPHNRTPSPEYEGVASTAMSGVRKGDGWQEITAIKPASHQLSRHSSTCSLANGSPQRHPVINYSFLADSRKSRLAGSHGSLPSSSTCDQKKPISSRPASLYGDASEIPPVAKLAQKRQRLKKQRTRDEVEIEEEFIDDEFNASLFEQPHMQLSMSSSENVLDRLSSSFLGDESGSSSSLNAYSHTTSSEEEHSLASKVNPPKAHAQISTSKDTHTLSSASESDFDDIFCGKTTTDTFKSSSLKKNLQKGVSAYLPKYSIGCSDSESGEM